MAIYFLKRHALLIYDFCTYYTLTFKSIPHALLDYFVWDLAQKRTELKLGLSYISMFAVFVRDGVN